MPLFHQKMMRKAIALAARGVGKTAPNPAVGCVIVRDGDVVGTGWHKKAGTPHAEVHALAAAGDLARGADAYVTLEPCAHYGKTPPCAKALVAAGVARVFVGQLDPNPLVAGKGMQILRDAGIAVESGILEESCRRLNEPFLKWITTKRPFVVLKSAITLDGKTATSSGDSQWVTSPTARREVHRLRGILDAIMVGVGTVQKDDPQLTCRVAGGKNPVRIVVDSGLNVPRHAAVLDGTVARTIVATCSTDTDRAAEIRERGAEILLCREREGQVDLDDLFAKLGAMGLQSVLLEGGSRLAGSVLRSGLVDKCLIFIAPKLVGGEGMGLFAGAGVPLMKDAVALEQVRVRKLGPDLLVEGYPAKAGCEVPL